MLVLQFIPVIFETWPRVCLYLSEKKLPIYLHTAHIKYKRPFKDIIRNFTANLRQLASQWQGHDLDLVYQVIHLTAMWSLWTQVLWEVSKCKYVKARWKAIRSGESGEIECACQSTGIQIELSFFKSMVDKFIYIYYLYLFLLFIPMYVCMYVCMYVSAGHRSTTLPHYLISRNYS